MKPCKLLPSQSPVPNKTVVMRPFWLCAWAVAMSLTWLLPNHYPPWSSFHMDAWAAIMLASAALAVIYRSTVKLRLSGAVLVVVAMALVVAAQYFAGMIYFAGTAWISFAYLLGLILAILVGQMWESTSPSQVGDALFLAIGIAAIVSVGLQFYGWLELEGLGVWAINLVRGRPYANFGQPNQLATFLLWGLIAAGWAFKRGTLGASTVVFACAYLLFGVALTGSRTAWVGVALLVAAAWFWRHILWGKQPGHWVVTFLGLYFVICCWSIGWINNMLELSMVDPFEVGRLTAGVRTDIWSSLFSAVLTRPLLGFGWNQVASAQLGQADITAALNLIFSHSHNLVLDFAVWAGMPFAVASTVFFAYWLFDRLKRAHKPETILLLLLVVVVANHAMLELPLHYAYFLLPLGLIIGAVDAQPVQIKAQKLDLLSRSRFAALAVWLLAVLMLVLVIKDYLKVERSYEQLRFSQINPQIHPSPTVPQVLFLTQWRDFFWLTNFEPTSLVTDAETTRMIELTHIFPSTGFAQKTATALVERGRHDEAKLILIRACRVNTLTQCGALRGAWADQARQNKRITFTTWP